MVHRLERLVRLTRFASSILSDGAATQASSARPYVNLQNGLAASQSTGCGWRQRAEVPSGFASLACFTGPQYPWRCNSGDAQVVLPVCDERLTSLAFGKQTRGMANQRPTKPKMKTPSSLKSRFRMNGKGQYKRFAASYVHKRFSKSGRQKRELKKRVILHKGYNYVLKKLNYQSRTF